jgi:hypothetical protein
MARQRNQSASTDPTAETAFKLPSAKDLMQKIAIAESEKASEAMRRDAAVAAEKKALLDRLSQPSDVRMTT